MAFETALSMSMSKPSIWPFSGFRAPSSRVSAETPAISRPRCLIFAIWLPEGRAAPATGAAPSGAKEATGLPQSGAGGVLALALGVPEAFAAGTAVVS